MNYTENYHLPQWEETDRIMRTDFNQMCADMEAGIMDVRGRAERGDEAVKALTAKAQTSANNAQTTANSALSKANAAYCPAFKPYYIGQYTGRNREIQTIQIGFRPSFLIITGQSPGGTDYTNRVAVADGKNLSPYIQFTDTGFILDPPEPADPSRYIYVPVFEQGRAYTFIAFY